MVDLLDRWWSDDGLAKARYGIDVFENDLSTIGAHKRRHAFDYVAIGVHVLEVVDGLDVVDGKFVRVEAILVVYNILTATVCVLGVDVTNIAAATTTRDVRLTVILAY
jgi:hypothetical protein